MYHLKIVGDQRWQLGAAIGSLMVFFGVSDSLKHLLVMTSHGIVTFPYAAARLLLAIMLALCMFFFIKTGKITTPGRIGYQRPIRTWLALIMLFFATILLGKFYEMSVVAPKPLQLFNIALIALSAGIYEEILCRGLLFSFFLGIFKARKQPLLWTAIASSLVFGLLHLMNLVGGQSLQTTLQQVFYAFVIGMMFSAIRISTNGLWVGILIHSLIDFDPSIATPMTGNGNWAVDLIVFIPLLMIAVLYLVNVDRLIVRQSVVN
ncbi:CPBP family intramembrane glutamic endopeptidase [Secundilactobacillus hailunensis]|uniref:CPBP family intramembrane glutamic endopeptidase n=1 Tax=Secundilactobacillus hailunensis TaxID=2559923 RepID=A0ABW1T870_9LACO|nr:CPBP family intramembrane glutamic endopeptidase [Secundilactobacillus hailunensis]